MALILIRSELFLMDLHLEKMVGKVVFAENGVKLIPHPAYSPDLAPCDFFPFPKLKEKIKGVHFNSAEEARLAYNEALQDLTKEDWHNCFESCLEGWIYAYNHLVH